MKKEKKPKSTFVSDPFAMPHLEIEEAQNSTDELILDEPLEEITTAEGEFSPIFSESEEEQIAKLSSAMVERQAQDLANLSEIAAAAEEEAKLELARQIAEDQELEQQLAAEQKELDEQGDAELMEALPKLNESGELDVQEVQSCIETLLFMTDKPMPLKKIKEYLGGETGEAVKSKVFKQAVAEMKERYASPAHGMEIVEVAGGLQFRTKPGRAALARLLSKVQTQRLSRGAMETLAIIAYKQPVMKEEIDSIRGVDSSHFVRGLLEKKLVDITGRSDLPGRPMLYSTSTHFLEVFALNEIADLPPLRELETMIPSSQTEGEDPMEDDDARLDPKTRMLRKLVHEMKLNSDQLGYNPQEDDIILKEIKERVKGISTTTPSLQQAADEEKQAKKGPAAGATAADTSEEIAPDLGLPEIHAKEAGAGITENDAQILTEDTPQE